ncbi:MAG: alpha/beta hydrolase family protein [Acidimicrobiales bacterium]
MVDVLLDIAVTNWEPRFTANGVDASDYKRITKGIETWQDWCAGWCAGALEHYELAESALRDGHTLSAGEHFARAATYYHFAKFLFVHDLDQAKSAHAKSLDAFERGSGLLNPRAKRETFSLEGTTLSAVFRAPSGSGPHPTVILIPGLDSAKEEFREVERTFLERGMATFALDGPGQGEAEWALPIRPDWDVVGAAVIDHLATMPDVDKERIGVWGVSLGGFYATRLAASDLPIRATIALAGPYDFAASWDNLNELTRRAFQVRSFSATPEDAQLRSRDFTLEGHTAKIKSPLLVIMGKKDRLFPWQDGERLARESAPFSTLVLLEEGNHGCANIVYRHRPLSADWMAQQLECANPQ